MDSLTHILMGHALGALATTLTPDAGACVYWAAFLGNSLPDLDVPVSLLLRRGIKLHRTFTHTLAGAVALTAGAALALRARFPASSVLSLGLWTLLGVLAHLAVDGLNLFGVRPFWPVSDRRVELGVLHITDPVLLLMLGLPALGAAAGWNPTSWVASSFLVMWVYVLTRIRSANRLIRGLLDQGALRARIVPWYSTWRYIAEMEHGVEFGRWHRGERIVLETFPRREDPRITASLADPRVSQFLCECEYPVARVEAQEVVWTDALRRLRADFRPLRVPVES